MPARDNESQSIGDYKPKNASQPARDHRPQPISDYRSQNNSQAP